MSSGGSRVSRHCVGWGWWCWSKAVVAVGDSDVDGIDGIDGRLAAVRSNAAEWVPNI